jgi:hypothetical protein
VISPPPPVSPPPPPPAATKPKRKVERGKAATRKPAKRKTARTKPLPIQPTIDEELEPTRAEPLAQPQAAPAASKKGSDLMTSPLVRVLLMGAASLALLTMLVAALPLAALERITETHWRTEQVATFVDGHRLDLVVAGVATLLVALVVALPTVAG